MNAAYVVMAAMSLFWSSQKQDIESDPARWATLAYRREELELTVKVPDKYVPIELRGNPQAPLALDRSVTFFHVQYDYGRIGSADISQFTVQASLIRLAQRPTSGLDDGPGLLNAISEALKLRPQRHEETSFDIVTVHGRRWLHSMGRNYDSYATLIGNDEILFIGGNYDRKILRDPKWLASRRQVVRQVLEQAILVEMPAR